MKTIHKIAIAIAALAALSGCGVAPIASDNALRDRAAPPAASGPVTDINLLELHGWYEANPIAATDWLKGRRLRFTAPVSQVSENFWADGRLVVVFRIEAGELLDSLAFVWYDGAFRSQIASLREGQIVTVEGVVTERPAFSRDLSFTGFSLK